MGFSSACHLLLRLALLTTATRSRISSEAQPRTTMARLQGLATELLCQILDEVAPPDVVNFTLSCKRIYDLAGKRLQLHKALRRSLTRVESDRRCLKASRFSEVLELVLIEPRRGDYVQHLVIDNWYRRFFEPNVDNMYARYCPPYPYSASKMEAFQKAIRMSGLIPLEEKVRWEYQIYAGDENPVLALLLPQLRYLTSIRLMIDHVADEFLFPTLERVVKQPRSSALSQLKEVEIRGKNSPLRLLTVFAALPSVTSLKASGLYENSRTYDEVTFPLIGRSSNLQEINLERCNISYAALFNLIISAKSLRSFTLVPPGDSKVIKYRIPVPSPDGQAQPFSNMPRRRSKSLP